MELNAFDLQGVHRVPEELKFGVLYVCFECNVVVHLCACGCGEKVVLPIDPDFWSVKYDGGTVSLEPSVGNYQFPCRSHYWIKENRVIWVMDSVRQMPKKKTRKRKRKCWMERFMKLF